MGHVLERVHTRDKLPTYMGPESSRKSRRIPPQSCRVTDAVKERSIRSSGTVSNLFVYL